MLLRTRTRKLRANTFGTGRIILVREEPKAIVVPAGAAAMGGDCFVVFVQDRTYMPTRTIRSRRRRSSTPVTCGSKRYKAGDKTEIIAGVLPGENVVVDGPPCCGRNC